MAKVGYIFKANHYDSYEADKEWMLKFGCVQVIEEETDHELMRQIGRASCRERV